MACTISNSRRLREALRPSRVSRSMRTTCCLWATMRVLTLVARAASLSNPRQPMWYSLRRSLSCAGRRVAAHGPEQFRRHLQGRQVARHVGRAAGHEALAFEIQHRHRRFRRNARHAAPDEMVEHRVADHQDAGAAAPRPGSGGRVAAESLVWFMLLPATDKHRPNADKKRNPAPECQTKIDGRSGRTWEGMLCKQVGGWGAVSPPRRERPKASEICGSWRWTTARGTPYLSEMRTIRATRSPTA